MGPTLEGYRVPKGEAFGAAGVLAGLCVVYGCVRGWIEDGNPFVWVSVWYLWLIIAIAFAYPLLFIRGKTTTCGSDWLMYNGKVWVNTYELNEIKVTKYAGGYHITLKDTSGRGMMLNLRTLQELPYLWNYVYLGIMHSVVYGGATANNEAIKRLQLPARIS